MNAVYTKAPSRVEVHLELLDESTQAWLGAPFAAIHLSTSDTFHTTSCLAACRKLASGGGVRVQVTPSQVVTHYKKLADCCGSTAKTGEVGQHSSMLVALAGVVQLYRQSRFAQIEVPTATAVDSALMGIEMARACWDGEDFAPVIEVLLDDLEAQVRAAAADFAAWVRSPEAYAQLKEHVDARTAPSPQAPRVLAASEVALHINDPLLNEVARVQLGVKEAFMVFPPELHTLAWTWEEQVFETNRDGAESDEDSDDDPVYQIFTCELTDQDDDSFLETASTLVRDGMDVAAAVAAARALTR